MTDKSKNLAIIHFDGVSKKRTNQSACAAIIQYQGEVYPVSQYLGFTTQNQTEYMGLILGLQKTLKLGAKQAKIYGDCELVINQLHGDYMVKNNNLVSFHTRAKTLLDKLDFYELIWINKTQNLEADQLANDCIDLEKSQK
ncbi:ribonuclease HI family protein [Moorena producens]|uniref:ribonuclease HI family protein n=1 Tax=Moorena producens TaxID=1155739 RepID=UPI003C7309B4